MKLTGFSFSLPPRPARFAPLLLAMGMGLAAHAGAQDLAPLPKPAVAALTAADVRWQSSMAAFAAADRDQLPATDGVLFVGSSTIRMWSSLAQDFRQLPVVINRGFGGSTMADCDHFSRQLVTRYRPKTVLVYAGDNDLAEGRTPAQVLGSFVNFVHAVRGELPGTRIAYISIKPSPSRAALLPRIREANALLAGYVQTLDNAEYIDIFTPMMAADGNPRPELFLADRLHMNSQGYALWQSVIAPRLPLTAQSPAPAVVPAVAQPSAAAPRLVSAR